MNKWLPVGLAIILVAAACGTGNPPQTFDWCYRYDFTSDSYEFLITKGTWALGTGFSTDVDGDLNITHFHPNTVEPDFIVISGVRAVGSDGDITISGSANIFNVSDSIDTVVPGFINEAQISMVPENAGVIGNNLSININASQAINLQSIEVRGDNANPFGDSNCSPQPTPTANPITPTPTDDPLVDTLTPSNTFTPSPTDTPSPTFTPSLTPSHSVTPSITLCYDHDFTEDDWDWVPDETDFGPRANYTDEGWSYADMQSGSVPNTFSRWLAIDLFFDSPVAVRKIEYDVLREPGTMQFANPTAQIITNTTLQFSTASQWSGLQTFTWNGSTTANSITLFARSSLRTSAIYEGSVIIKAARIYCTDPPTATPTHTASSTPITTSTNTRTRTPIPSRTQNVIASATPSAQCLTTNFDDLNQLTLTYPPGGGSGSVSFPAGGNPPDGNALRFSTELDGGVHVNERAFFIQTQPSWLIQSLSYSYRVINNGTEEGSARYMWWDTGTGPARVGTSLSIGGSINWSQATISGINVSGYSGIGVEYNIVRSALSHVEIDNVQLCFSVLQTPSPSPTRTATLDIPTLDVTPTFITSTATIPPTTTLIPFPTALPTWDLTSTPEGGPEAEQVDLLTGIADSIGGFFNFIINTTLNFFNWLGSFIGWIGGILNNFLIMIGNLIAAIVGFFNLVFTFIGAVVEIIGLILAIIWHLLHLAAEWIGQFIAAARTIYNTWYLAPAQPIPFLPNCVSNPTTSDICAFWYIVRYTILGGTIGSLIIPIAVIVADLGIVFGVILTVRNLIKNVRGVAE